MLDWLVVAWFFGGAGLILGGIAGAINLRVRGVSEGWPSGFLLGLIAGGVLSVLFWRDVAGSSSSTAAIGLLFVPIPPITNGIVGGLAAELVPERKTPFTRPS
jgi:hypothetical protein